MAVEYKQIKLRPPLEFCAPMAVSAWPPVPENCVDPIDSLAHWPVRSTSMVELIDTMLSFCAMT